MPPYSFDAKITTSVALLRTQSLFVSSNFKPEFFFQCAFDIVTPTEVSLVADAEVLCVADKVLQVIF